MRTIHNLGLPASECAKLVPARPAQDQPPAGGDVASAVARDAVTAAPTARTQPASHLSGFARA